MRATSQASTAATSTALPLLSTFARCDVRRDGKSKHAQVLANLGGVSVLKVSHYNIPLLVLTGTQGPAIAHPKRSHPNKNNGSFGASRPPTK